MGRFKAHSIAKNKELLYAVAVVVSNKLVLKQNKEAVKRNQYGGRD